MPLRRCSIGPALIATTALLLGGGCASLPERDPLQVTVSDIEGLPAEGMEIRMLVKLRVQNPNEDAIEFSGASLQLDVLDRTFATGVSNEGGMVPAFGETIVAVPVTVSMMRMARQVIGMMDGQPVEKIHYELSGKLGGGLFGTERFSTRGEIDLAALRSPPPGTT